VFRVFQWHTSANPFAAGFLHLTQSGADTLVQWDYDGTGGASDLFTLVEPQNVNASILTAFNFAGFDPLGGANAGATIDGTGLGDTLYGDSGGNTINGLDGNDRLSGGLGDDAINGGLGDDVLEGGAGSDTLHGGDGNDLVHDTGFGSDTWIYGDAGNDTIAVDHSYSFADETLNLFGGDGNDTVDVTVNESSGHGVTVVADLGAGDDEYIAHFVPYGNTALTLGTGADRVHFGLDLLGQGLSTTVITDFQAGAGGDIVDIAAYIYALEVTGPWGGYAFEGWEHYNPFETGDAQLIQSGNDVLLQVARFSGDATPTTLIDFRNTTLASFTNYNFGIDIALSTAPATSGADVIGGTVGRDVIRGGAGNDQLSGLGGDDVLVGGAGDDTLVGGDGFNVLLGGGGTNTLTGGSGVDVIYGFGSDTIDAGAGDDEIHTNGVSHVIAGAGNDHIVVGPSGDPETAPDTANTIYAGDGDDTYYFYYGSFAADGGAGSDIFNLGAQGYYRLTLGSGADTVHFNSDSLTPDCTVVITDFQAGDGGDVVILQDSPHPTSNPFDNPFYSGQLTLEQVGADVVLTTTYTIYVNTPLITFKNANLADFSAANFNGFSLDFGFDRPILVSNTDVIVQPGEVQASLDPVATDNQGFAAHFLYDHNSAGSQLINHGHVTTGISPSDPLAGTIAGIEVGYYASELPGGRVVNAADGVIEVHSQGHDAFGFYAPSIDIPFQNDGQLLVTSDTAALGVFAGFRSLSGGAITNTGTISAHSDDTAYGVYLKSFGSLLNSGTIEAVAGVYAVGASVRVGFQANSIVNEGIITATTDPASPYASIGLLVEGSWLYPAGNVITNSGLIEADIAVTYIFGTGSLAGQTLNNSGTIAGAVLMGEAGDTIVNTGDIYDATELGGGDDLYDGTGGFHWGTVGGGDGNDIILGGAGSEWLFGDPGYDQIDGGAGDDLIDGGADDDALDGGAGADVLFGGTGNDSFRVDQQADLVFEDTNEGADSVVSTASFYLYANVENLTLAAGAGDLFGVGNELANSLTGNEGSNLLIAGLGNDTVHGGGGVDSLFGEDGADALYGDAGIDYLVGGIGNDTVDGGAEADAIYGEAGDDTLTGGAGFVTDILVGGDGNDALHADSGMNDYDLIDGSAGDDIYYVDTGDDLTFEAADGGIDTVYADVSNVANAGVYLYANVEKLVLLGTTAFGVGNELANTLTGSASGNWLLGGVGNDSLNGKAGGDVLFGEAGNDTFVFEHGTGGDVIGDFAHGSDKMNLADFHFASFAALQAGFHQSGSDGAIDLGGGDFVVLLGVTMATLDAGDFVL
jgi:Ca2+-binding RTX toxin-like protein